MNPAEYRNAQRIVGLGCLPVSDSRLEELRAQCLQSGQLSVRAAMRYARLVEADVIELLAGPLSAARTLKALGYVWKGGEAWAPPSADAQKLMHGRTCPAPPSPPCPANPHNRGSSDWRSPPDVIAAKPEMQRQLVRALERLNKPQLDKAIGLLLDYIELVAAAAADAGRTTHD